MDELLKDLENDLYEGYRFWTKAVCEGESFNDAETFRYLAVRLASLGWVKPVRCGECEYEKDCEQIIIKSHEAGAEYLTYCSEGERVVAKSATGEEVAE